MCASDDAMVPGLSPGPQRTMHHDQDTMNTCEYEDIRSIEDLEMVSETTIWQNFERLTAFIFEKNDFTVNVNTVKTGNKKKAV